MKYLFRKWRYVGFSGKVFHGLNRIYGKTFNVTIDKKFSDPGDLTCGVPEGSILGLLLLLSYVNVMTC